MRDIAQGQAAILTDVFQKFASGMRRERTKPWENITMHFPNILSYLYIISVKGFTGRSFPENKQVDIRSIIQYGTKPQLSIFPTLLAGRAILCSQSSTLRSPGTIKNSERRGRRVGEIWRERNHEKYLDQKSVNDFKSELTDFSRCLVMRNSKRAINQTCKEFNSSRILCCWLNW